MSCLRSHDAEVKFIAYKGSITMEEIDNRQTDDQLRQFYKRLCERIGTEDEKLHVFVPGTCVAGEVMARVETLLAEYPDAADRPPLFGVPVGVKDIFHSDGFVTRCGSDLPPELFQGEEAETVARLKAAGAVVMGKTATTEFAYFAPAATCNPRNPSHTPGGSSSGSAAGVAAGFVTYALGTQTVGSVIRPASYCGVAGFKPSLGRVSTHGVVTFSWTVDHVGVFGPTAASLPPVLAVLDSSWQVRREPGAIRLGVPEGPYLEQAERPALGLFRERLRQLEIAGYEIVEVPVLDEIQAINERHSLLIAAEIARVHAPWYQAQKETYRAATRKIIEDGLAVADDALAPLRDSCTRLRHSLEDSMQRHRLDAWICPATTGEAPEGLAATGSPLMNLPWTHAGLPAVTVDGGNGPGGLPLGIQLIGPFMGDEPLVAVAVAIEAALA